MGEEEARKEILDRVKGYFKLYKKPKKFSPGDRIPYAARVFDENELTSLVDSSLEFWLTEGRYAEKFKAGLAKAFEKDYCSLTVSGSSANLLALTSLTSKLLGERRLRKGDVVITAAAGFPTTVNPIFQNCLIPRFVDIELGTYNASTESVKAAIEDGKARAIMLAHTLGNPFEPGIIKLAQDKGLFLIEDCCDALGAKIGNHPVGFNADLATVSFYPAHHITTGEGGAVVTSDKAMRQSVESFRDWGRDCWCKPGKDNTCGKRFGQKHGNLPFGYDHKYVYSNIGYNMKMTDLQAAIGLAQLEKLPQFIKRRQDNFDYFLSKLSKHSSKFILPKKTKGTTPSPFGFLLTVKDGAGFTRAEIVSNLESKGISTRMLFAGNLTKQPAYLDEKYEVSGSLENSDKIMNSTFWFGVYPGITDEIREYMVGCFRDFLSGRE